MRVAFIVSIGLLTMASAQGAGQQRARALATQFQSYCLAAKPDFDSLGQRAEQEKLHVQLDRKTPMGANAYMSQRNWVVEDFTGQLLLLTTNGQGGDARVPTQSCGFAATDVGGDAIEKALAELPALRSPTFRSAIPSGGVKVQWNKALAWGNAEIILASGIPGMKGSMVTVVYRPQGP